MFDRRPGYRTPFHLTTVLDKVAALSPLHRIEEILVWDVRDCVDDVANFVAQGRMADARESTRVLCYDLL